MVVSLAVIHYKIHYVQYRSQRCITIPSKHKAKVQNITTEAPKQNNTTNVRSMFSDKYPVACVLQPRMFDPLKPLKSTLGIHSPLFSTTNPFL